MSLQQNQVEQEKPSKKAVSKKDQILSLFMSGITTVEDLALITNTRPSYVGSILQDAGLKPGYFDLYTSTSYPMNIYSKFFSNQLGFKDVEAAENSIMLIDRYYRQFELAKDRAGQHHALLMALTMFNRARWTGKAEEARIFRTWLSKQLEDRAINNEDLSKEDEEAGELEHLPSLSVSNGATNSL
jgi:hypothetical protein